MKYLVIALLFIVGCNKSNEENKLNILISDLNETKKSYILTKIKYNCLILSLNYLDVENTKPYSREKKEILNSFNHTCNSLFKE